MIDVTLETPPFTFPRKEAVKGSLTTTRPYLPTAQGSAVSLAAGTRDTKSDVPKRGVQRQLRIPPHFRDRHSSISFLVDTVADLCVYPRNKLHETANKDERELFAANGTRIVTYGTILVSLDLSLRQAFKWRFVTDVNMPIITSETQEVTKTDRSPVISSCRNSNVSRIR